jgi:hypothetical protein
MRTIEDEIGATCSTNGGEEERVWVIGWKARVGRPRRRWVDNIKMDLGEIAWSGVEWTGLAQDRAKWKALVNSVMNL